MPAIRVWLRGTAGALAGMAVIAIQGCGWDAEAVSSDIADRDRISTPVSRQIWRDEEDMPDQDTPRNLVERITPDNREAVREMKELNPDTIGWLYIPGTGIDRVILQNPPEEKDNSYYLNVDFNGNQDRDGTFCADYRANFGNGSWRELNRNTVIYGHSWTDDPDGPLFASLKKYRDPEFAREHPYIFFSTESDNIAWEVFAVFDATVELPYISPGYSPDKFYRMLDLVYDLSYYSYDSALAPQDKVLTLSTCVYSVKGNEEPPMLNDYRFSIMARLVSPYEYIMEEAVFAVNADHLAPDELPDCADLW